VALCRVRVGVDQANVADDAATLQGIGGGATHQPAATDDTYLHARRFSVFSGPGVVVVSACLRCTPKMDTRTRTRTIITTHHDAHRMRKTSKNTHSPVTSSRIHITTVASATAPVTDTMATASPKLTLPDFGHGARVGRGAVGGTLLRSGHRKYWRNDQPK